MIKPNCNYAKKTALILVVILLLSFYSPLAVNAEISLEEAILMDALSGLDGKVLQWYLVGAPPSDFSAVLDKANEYIKEKLDISMKIDFLDWLNFIDKKQIMFAAGEKIDLIFSAGWFDYKQDVSMGLYHPIKSKLDFYAPQTKALLGNNFLKAAEINGDLYALPIAGVTATASGVMLRKDILDKYKLDYTKIRTLADLEPMLQKVKAGEPAIIPMVNSSTGLCYDLLNAEKIDDAAGPGSISSLGSSTNIFNEFAAPETMAFLKTLHSYYKQGLMKVSNNIQANRENGKIFAILSEGMNPEPVESSKYKWVNVILGKPVIGFSHATAIMHSIAERSAYKNEALKLLELINTDSYLSNLLRYGIEGIHYKKAADNIMEITRPDYSNLVGWMMGNRFLDFDIKGKDSDVNNKIKDFNNKAALMKSAGFHFDITSLKNEVSACDAAIEKYLPALLSGEYDPAKYLTVLNTDLKKAGVDKIIGEKQKQFDAWLKKPENIVQVAAVSDIKLMLDGSPLTLSTPAILENNVVLVQMESIYRSLDTFYFYDPNKKIIFSRKNNIRVSMWPGSLSCSIDGNIIPLAAAPQLINNQVFIPLDAVCSSLGYNYSWDAASKTAIITTTAEAPHSGNSAGNIMNKGVAVSDGIWHYISLPGSGLVKMKKDGSEKTQISDIPAYYLNLSGDWLYYLAEDSDGSEKVFIYKQKTDGTQRTKLSSTASDCLILSGEWLYYINEDDGNKPYRMGFEGNAIQKISDVSINSMFVEDGWIYCQIFNDPDIYKMRTSGSDVRKLADISNKDACFIKAGSWIYFNEISDDLMGFCRVSTDGGEKEFITGIYSGSFNYSDGNIFFLSSGKAYKLNVEEKELVPVGYNVQDGILILDDWMFFTNYSITLLPEYELTETVVRIKTDASCKQFFDNSGGLIDIYDLTKLNENKPNIKSKAAISVSGDYVKKTPKEIVKQKNAVAYIKTYDETGKESGTGSGFNVDRDGIVVTNYHVISGANSIKCTFDNGKTYDVDYILNFNEIKDIAIIHLKNASNLPVVTLGDSDKIELADEVIAIGNPVNMQNTVSDGIVSGIRSMYGVEMIQITAAISPGSSGGPLFNSYGNVIGITSMTMSNAQNINFAIPVNYARDMLKDLKKYTIPEFNLSQDNTYELEKNDTPEASNHVNIDSLISGMLMPDTDKDYFSFSIKEKSKLRFTGMSITDLLAEKTESTFTFSLLDQNGRQIYTSRTVMEEGTPIQLITADLNPGTYNICVSYANTDKKEFPTLYMLLAVKEK